MTIFLVILAILLVGGTAVLASGRPLPRGFRRFAGRSALDAGEGAAAGADGPAPGSDANLGLVQPVASLPPVLLPDCPSARDVDAVRFGLGLRGYRMDQVDQVLDALAAALDRRDAVIRDLRAELAERNPGA